MNTIIISAVLGIILMLGGVFLKSKGIPKYLAIAGMLVLIFANFTELKSGESFFDIDVRDMLHFNSFNLSQLHWFLL
jgi:NADH-quinone oxidoreductase subunit N